MLLILPKVLNSTEIVRTRALLEQAPANEWQDGRSSAGRQAALVKNNEQLSALSEQAQALRALVLSALDRHAAFFSAALPKRVWPPSFNRYSGAHNAYGPHVDSAIRLAENGQRLRTDLSATLFLSDPGDYDGGELLIEDGSTPHSIKLPAGDMVLYPGTSVHQVLPVTRGQRMASFFWIESLVRSLEQRQLLYEMDQALTAVRESLGDNTQTVALAGTYHNLLRMWADT